MVTLEDAKDVSRRLVEDLNPLSVVLFGSVGSKGIGADLDLLIIVSDETGTQDRDLMVHRSLRNYYKKFPIDPFVLPLSLFSDHYAKGSPFLRAILKQGRLLYMKNAVREWMQQADNEYAMSTYLLQGRFYKGACYHAQQSVEITVKALLLNKGWELEKTHNLERLMSIAETYKISIRLSEKEIIFLDGIYRGRYPLEAGLLPMSDPSEADARNAVEMAGKALQEAKESLNP